MKTYLPTTPLAGRADSPLAPSKPGIVLSTDTPSHAVHCGSVRQGMTLVELLVVTVLLSILVTTAIPVISPNNDSRKIREASRSINAYLAAAQAKAIETGRPYGVEFTRLSDSTGSGEDNGTCIQLTQIEVPPHYTGIDSRSVARITTNYVEDGFRQGNLDFVEPYTLQFLRIDTTNSSRYVDDLFPPSTIRPNDIVEFMGHRFYVVVNDPDDLDNSGYCKSNLKQLGLRLVTYHVDEDDPTGSYAEKWEPISFVPKESPENLFGDVSIAQILPYIDDSSVSFDQTLAFWTSTSSYKIERQPMPSSAEPLQLPAGMAVDMTVSGVDLDDNTNCRFYQPSDAWDGANGEFITAKIAQSPRLVFNPSGQAWIHMPGQEPKPITGNLSLCVGRVELVNYEIYDDNKVNTFDDPIDLQALYDNSRRDSQNAVDTNAVREVTDKYNWLNMDSRWVVVSGRSGAISTVSNSFVNPDTSNLRDINDDERFGIDEQLIIALQNAPTRTSAGGR